MRAGILLDFLRGRGARISCESKGRFRMISSRAHSLIIIVLCLISLVGAEAPSGRRCNSDVYPSAVSADGSSELAIGLAVSVDDRDWTSMEVLFGSFLRHLQPRTRLYIYLSTDRAHAKASLTDYVLPESSVTILVQQLTHSDMNNRWLRQLQQTLRHEEDILAEDLDLLIVIDLMRAVWLVPPHGEPGETAADEERHQREDAAIETQIASECWQETGTGHGQEARNMDSGRGGNGLPEDSLLLQPLFASCTSSGTSTNTRAHVKKMLRQGFGGEASEVFPCSLSSHFVGGSPSSVLALAAAASSLLESLHLSHFDAQGTDDEGDTQTILHATMAMQAERFRLFVQVDGSVQQQDAHSWSPSHGRDCRDEEGSKEGGASDEEGGKEGLQGRRGKQGEGSKEEGGASGIKWSAYRSIYPSIYTCSPGTGGESALTPHGDGCVRHAPAAPVGMLGQWDKRWERWGKRWVPIEAVGRALADVAGARAVMGHKGEMDEGQGVGGGATGTTGGTSKSRGQTEAGGGGRGSEGERATGWLTIVGHPGRLGNWLFRAASGLALAWDSKRELALARALPCLTHHDNDARPPPPPCSFSASFLSHIRRVERLDVFPWHAVLDETSFSYSAPLVAQVLAAAPASNLALSGFFQSHRYFHHHRARLLRTLRLPEHAEQQAQQRLATLLAPFLPPAVRKPCARPPPASSSPYASSKRARVVEQEADGDEGQGCGVQEQRRGMRPGKAGGSARGGEAASGAWERVRLELAYVIALHVRRTDYVEYPSKHPMLTRDYYAKALEVLEGVMGRRQWRKRILLVFCDDTTWCKEQQWIARLGGRGVVVVEEDAPDFIDLRVMSLCRFLVIANSSFSWWAAYLSVATRNSSPPDGEEEEEEEQMERGAGGSEHRGWRLEEGEGAGMGEELEELEGWGRHGNSQGQVIAPAEWFGVQGPAWEPDDLYPADWIVV